MKELRRIDDVLKMEEENMSPFELVDNYRRMSEYLKLLQAKLVDSYWTTGEEAEHKIHSLLSELDRTLFDHSGEDE